MKQVAFLGAALFALAIAQTGCVYVDVEEAEREPEIVEKRTRVVKEFKPETTMEALRPYYASLPDSILPIAPEGVSLDPNKPLTHIIVASCHDEETRDPALQSVAEEGADLFLFIGDNVYGDMDGRTYMNYDLDLSELRAAYTDLAAAPEFQAVRASTPMMVAWDDHDLGVNDGGADFPAKEFSERIFENFWGLEDEPVATYPGTYMSNIVGPEGQRTQIIMLDTRFFRSELTRTDEYGVTGKERYIPSPDPDQDVLGDAQWAWLETELKKPADLRLLVSSIQITADVHGWEAWDKMPIERQRLYDLISDTGAEGVVLISGDRHTAYMYKDVDRGPYPLYELTASSLNVSFSSNPVSPEVDERQVGSGYALTNYGDLAIDWEARTLTMAIKSEAGDVVHAQTLSLDELQHGAS